MMAYFLQRLLWLVPVLLAIALITFVLMHLAPGSPCLRERLPPPDVLERCEERLGLDLPLWQQLGKYVLNMAHGDLGFSVDRKQPVSDLLADGIGVSAVLGVLALAVSVGLGVSLGVASALRRNTLVDYAGVALATVGASLPSFILGILLLSLFVGRLHWLPSGGWGSAEQAIMPVIALSALPAAYVARVTRSAVLDTLGQDYTRTARAKGLPERAVVLRHVLRNALIPVVTVIGPIAAFLVTGSFLVENLFGIPGAGKLYADSIGNRDYALIMGASLFYALVVALANLAVDLGYGVIDPRLRHGVLG